MMTTIMRMKGEGDERRDDDAAVAAAFMHHQPSRVPFVRTLFLTI